MKNRMLGLMTAILAVAMFASPVRAESFTWSAASYGTAPFLQGGVHSVAEYKQEMAGSYGEEVHDAMGLPGYYRVLITTLLAKSSQAVQISVSSPEDFEREAVRKYRSQFVPLGDGILGLCVQGVMPAGPYGARHDRMGFKSKGRAVVVHNVVQTFDAMYYGVILMDAASLKGVSIGTLERCGNPTVRSFLYVRDVDKQVIIQKEVIEKPVEVEKIVEVPVDRIVEKEVRVEVPVDRIVERVVEKEVCVNTLIFVPRRLDDVPCGKLPTPARWISTRPGALAIGADLLGTVAGIASPFLARGTSIRVGGSRAFGFGGSAAAASSSSSSASNRNTNTNQNQNNNANSNTQGQGQSQGR